MYPETIFGWQSPPSFFILSSGHLDLSDVFFSNTLNYELSYQCEELIASFSGCSAPTLMPRTAHVRIPLMGTASLLGKWLKIKGIIIKNINHILSQKMAYSKDLTFQGIEHVGST